jgi:hypothetical protein
MALEKRTRSFDGRPPIVLSSIVNLIHLYRNIKGFVEDSFEFRNTRNGTGVIIKDMAEFRAIKPYFDKERFHYFSFHPKSQKPIKAVIRHLPKNILAEGISSRLVDIGFRTNIKQMTVINPPPEGGHHTITLHSS